MVEKTKVLIAYDDSDHARAALNDLRRAGLPRETEALVVSVAGGLSTSPSSASEIIALVASSRRVSSAIALARSQEALALKEAQELALEASRQIQSKFPHWEVRAEGLLGTPAAEIIRKAEEWQADLVVVGSRGRSGLGRLVLGSVSQKVVNEAGCSVRVARHQPDKGDSPVRIIIGTDGSTCAEMAARALAVRAWPAESELHLITAVKPFSMYGIVPEEQRKRLSSFHQTTEAMLREAGLRVSSAIKEGEARSVLIAEAKAWRADCIFVGSRGFNSRLERFMLGSVSTAVVNGAHCSVEVVRMREPP